MLKEIGIKSAPLWDTDEREFVGLVSISDFVEILLQCFDDAKRLNGGNAAPAQCDAYVVSQLQK